MRQSRIFVKQTHAPSLAPVRSCDQKLISSFSLLKSQSRFGTEESVFVVSQDESTYHRHPTSGFDSWMERSISVDDGCAASNRSLNRLSSLDGVTKACLAGGSVLPLSSTMFPK
jgi:hypothetical protein